ncbi:hypothetical protein QOZ88_05810 [Blastococcus sp. BMG 814]|uniref:Uncharacterized protein n=1 Tax=Blastococcus carthaginiensis TaxID=3050034 RepID=A0ABT9I989_9ACTN|nr:hypothetical protein [Blastococcus carthaginiensis]MDP5182145.1 hypothetical protein [Blastococcus carthaginiensis]
MNPELVFDVVGVGLLVVGLGGLAAFLRSDRRARAEIRDLERRIRQAEEASR